MFLLLLRLASRAALLQFLVFFLLLLPLLRRQPFGALGQGHAAGLGGLGTSRCGWGFPGGGAGGADSRMEFSRFAFTGRAGHDGLPRSLFARASSLSRLRRVPGVPRPRLGRGCRLARFLMGDLLDLLGHLGGQGHGGLGGQRRD